MRTCTLKDVILHIFRNHCTLFTSIKMNSTKKHNKIVRQIITEMLNQNERRKSFFFYKQRKMCPKNREQAFMEMGNHVQSTFIKHEYKSDFFLQI